MNRRLHKWSIFAAVGILFALVSCSDTGQLLFSGPATLEVEGPTELVGTVGEPVDVPTMRVTDDRGNPVPGVEVTFQVAEGQGRVAPESMVTNREGRARPSAWVLDRTAGDNVLVVALGEVGDVRVEAQGLPGPAEQLVALDFDDATAPVATALPERPAVKVMDEFGNPVSGVDVLFHAAEGSGSVDEGRATSDAEGVARAGFWRLGTKAGSQTLQARLAAEEYPAVDPVTLEATALPGPPARLEAVGADFREVPRGGYIPERPQVLVEDEYNNVVPGAQVNFSVATGGGAVAGAQVMSSADGTAAPESWALGCDPGLNQLVASVDGAGEVIFEAEALEVVALSVRGVHLNQGNQSPDGSVGGVAHRPGLLRVIAEAGCENSFQPEILVRLLVDGSIVKEERISAQKGSVPQEMDLVDLESTWNLALSAEEVQAGLEVEAIVDPDGVLGVEEQHGFRFPRDGGSHSLDVEPLAPLRMVFFPVHLTVQVSTGAIDESNAEDFLEDARRWIPVSEITWEVRETFSTDWNIDNRDRLVDILSDLQALRVAEGAQDEYYHGILPASHWMGGLAYRPRAPHQEHRSALVHDRLPRAASTLGHELGHNLGRQHSPCGDPTNYDSNFPYDDGGIGPPGYDVVEGEVRYPADYADYMSHCRPRWTSDYMYGAIVDWRREDPLVPETSALQVVSEAVAEAASRGLLLWGRINRDGVVLNPGFVIDAPARLPTEEGAHELRGFDDDGEAIFALSFEGAEVAHLDMLSERHFAFVVPLDDAELQVLSRIELHSPHGRTEWKAGAGIRPEVGAAPADPVFSEDPEVQVSPLTPDQHQLRWNAERYPAVLVRNRTTGQIIGIARSGALDLRAGAEAELEVEISDGVRSRTWEPR